MSDIFSDLIGKKVAKFLMSENGVLFGFDCDGGEKFNYVSTGDCCAQSWVQHVSGLNWLIGNRINEVIEREYQENTEPDYGDHVDVFGYTFVTDKGRFDLEFRGEHNGYYFCYVKQRSIDQLSIMSEVLKEF